MKKLSLTIREKALQDLEKIWIYTFQKWSKEQADRYYQLLIEEMNFLTEQPYSGEVAEEIREGYRVSFVKSHIIFYKITNNEILEIIRILHQKVDIENWID